MAQGNRPDGSNQNYGRKPYIAGQYDDQKELMNRPARRAMENQRESPRSYEDKPYMEDTGDYQAMEHWAPNPFALNLPDINLQIRPASPGPVPDADDWDVPTESACFVTCKSPGRDCSDPIKCRPGVYAGSWLEYVTDIIDIEVFINGVLHTDWQLIPSLPDPLRINAPAEGWTQNPPGPGDQVNVIFRDKVTGLIACSSFLVNVSCDVDPCPCDGDDYVAVNFDVSGTSETIDPGETISIYIDDGCPPFTWSVSGNGYSLKWIETDDRYNELTCDEGT